ncbi:MAG: hypothetical protein ACYSYM_07700, partial [Planctomycetota bacterium]
PWGVSGLQCPLGSFLFKALENRPESGCKVTSLAKSVIDRLLTSIAFCPAFAYFFSGFPARFDGLSFGVQEPS